MKLPILAMGLLLSSIAFSGCKPKQAIEVAEMAMNVNEANEARKTFKEAETLEKVQKKMQLADQGQSLQDPEFQKKLAELKAKTGISNPKELIEYLKKHPDAVKSVLAQNQETPQEILASFQKWAVGFTDLSTKGAKRLMENYPGVKQITPRGGEKDAETGDETLQYLFPHSRVTLVWKEGVVTSVTLEFALLPDTDFLEGSIMPNKLTDEQKPLPGKVPAPFHSWYHWFKTREKKTHAELTEELNKILQPDPEKTAGIEEFFPYMSPYTFEGISLNLMWLEEKGGIYTVSFQYSVSEKE